MDSTTPVDSTTSNIGPYHPYDMYYDFISKHSPVVIILIILNVLSVLSNILVVLISGFCMRLRSLTSIFILNLALSDLLFTAGPLFSISNYIWGSISRHIACRVVGFVSSTGFYTSTVLLVLMNVQRYMVTVHSYSGWKKGRCVTLIFFCVWMAGIVAALSYPVYMLFLPGPEFCMYSSETTVVSSAYRMNIFFVCASVIMCFCFIRILQTIIKSPTNQKHRTTVLILPLAVKFFICWAPYNIAIFLCILAKYWYRLDWGDHVQNAMYIFITLAFSRCCINPIIYGSFGLKFRKKILPRRNTLTSAQNEIELNKVPELDICSNFQQ